MSSGSEGLVLQSTSCSHQSTSANEVMELLNGTLRKAMCTRARAGLLRLSFAQLHKIRLLKHIGSSVICKYFEMCCLD